MRYFVLGLAGLCTASAASATEPTDFGIRSVDGSRSSDVAISLVRPAVASVSIARTQFAMGGAVAIGRQWGVVTSTYRSPEHNRRVGGARNSWHMQNRAIDIARKPGVRHYQIAAAYKAAGYRLIESLDEGDHSHFAFASGVGGAPAPSAAPIIERPAMQMVRTGPKPTDFRIVTAPGAH